jgi:hypothetical protein
VRKRSLSTLLFLALFASAAGAGIDWRHDIRAAFEEAEERGVALFVFLARDT